MYLIKNIQCSIRIQIKRLTEYRIALLNQIFGLFIGYISTFIVYYLMFQKFTGLEGWSFNEVMYVYSFAMLTINLSSVIFNHFRHQDQEIIDGSFDKYLIKPLSPFTYFCISRIDVVELLNLFLSMIVYLYFAIVNQVYNDVYNVMLIFLFMFTSTLINGSLLVLIGALSFWTKKSEILYSALVWPFQFLSYLPIVIFPKAIQYILTYILPFGMISYYPAMIILKRIENVLVLSSLILLVSILFFGLSYIIWKIGLKKYEGTGS